MLPTGGGIPQPRLPMLLLPGRWAGLVAPGNIDIANRPVVPNKGNISTVLSTSFTDPRTGREVLVPRVVAGKILSPKAAWMNYVRTGQNLGAFRDPRAADAYALALHRQQARLYGGG